MENLTKEKVILFAKKQWKPLALGGVIFVILIITLLIPSGNKSQQSGHTPSSRNTHSSGNNTDKKPFSIFGDKPTDEKKTPVVDTQEAIDKSLSNIHSGNPQAPIPTGIVRVLPNGTKTTQNSGGAGTVQTAQGTISTQSNIQTGVTSNDQVDNIRIVFKNTDGSTTTYIPPGTPPNEVRWGRYTNNRYNYAINYPVNWRLFYSIDQDGHEGIALYPPYVNPNDPNAPFIGFGLTEKFLLPAVGDTANALITNIKVDGVSGDLYTEGPLGKSYMASTFRYTEKYFGLGASMSDATFAYVYYYMLFSLTFNLQ